MKFKLVDRKNIKRFEYLDMPGAAAGLNMLRISRFNDRVNKRVNAERMRIKLARASYISKPRLVKNPKAA